jgi:outer membrane lipoprotein carrier protein
MMHCFKQGISWLILLLLCGSPAFAGQDIVAEIQRRYATMQSFQAEFTQKLRTAASREVEERRGKLFYQHPGLIRWETREPENELLIIGPETVWNYFPDEEIAYRYATQDVLGSAAVLRILSGQARLDADFITEEDVLEPSPGPNQSPNPDPGKKANQNETAGPEQRVITLRPKKPEPSLIEATIWIDARSLWLRQVRAVDFYGNENQVSLRDFQLNPELAPKLFEFTPPEGVHVQQ